MKRPLVLIIALSLACAPYRFVPEPPHPSPERIAELARIDQSPADVVRELTIRVSPRFVLAGGAARITCLLPQTTTARSIAFGLADVRTAVREVDRFAFELVVTNISCGEWTAYCLLATGAHVIARAELPLIAKGACNDGASPK